MAMYIDNFIHPVKEWTKRVIYSVKNGFSEWVRGMFYEHNMAVNGRREFTVNLAILKVCRDFVIGHRDPWCSSSPSDEGDSMEYRVQSDLLELYPCGVTVDKRSSELCWQMTTFNESVQRVAAHQ